MVKKIFIPIISVVAIIIIVATYQHFKSVNQEKPDIWLSASPDAIALITSSNFHSIWENLNESSLIWQELKLLPELNQFNTFLIHTDSVINQSDEASTFFNQTEFLVSVIPSGAGKADLMISSAVAGNFELSHFLQLVADKNSIGEGKVYDEIHVTSWKIQGKEFYAALCKNILLISSSSLVIESSIRNLNRNISVIHSVSFNTIKNTAGRYAKANVFINYKELGKLIDHHVVKKFQSWSGTLTNFAHWGVLDLDLKSNGIILNGFSNCDKAGNNYISIFNNQEPQTLSLKGIAPSNTAILVNLGISSFSIFLESYREWLDAKGELFNYRKKIDAINKKYGANASALAVTWIGNQIGFGYTSIASASQLSQHKFLIFEADNILNAKRDLALLAGMSGYENTIETYRGLSIKKIGIKNLYGLVLGSGFNDVNNPYYTCIDDFVIMANSISTLRDIITKTAVNKNLENAEHFKKFNSQISSDGNILVYGNLAKANIHGRTILTSDLANWMKLNQTILNNFQSFAFEWSKEQHDLFYQHAILNYNPSYKQETGSLWELDLDGANITTKPLFVKNHYSGNKEVLVQDDKFNLYLISNVGKLLWKKQLKEAIIGTPVQIDAYKNNKLQYAFVTKNQLHLIDRNGNDVEGYPITLISRATTALAVFDYDNNRNYRMLVGCEDGKVYNYLATGEVVGGWKFKGGKSAITSTIRHFTIGKKDYILIVEQNGKIHCVDRQGSSRHEVTKPMNNQSLLNEYKLVLGKNIENSYIYYTNRTGSLVKQQFNGNTTVVDLDLSEDHLFTMDDINNDGSLEVICTSENKIMVLTLAGKIILEKEYEEKIARFINTYHFPNNVKRIGFLIPSTKEVHLIDILGKNHTGFPLYGETDFSIADINKEKVFSLVTAGSKGKIYTYNLN